MSRAVIMLLALAPFARCAAGGSVTQLQEKVVPGSVDVRLFDLRPFSTRGFLFTQSTYKGDYDPIGILSVQLFAGKKSLIETETKIRKTSNALLFGTAQTDTLVTRHVVHTEYEEIDAADALEALYGEAISLGADAVTGLTVSIDRAGTSITGVSASGFAIKRHGAFSPANRGSDQ